MLPIAVASGEQIIPNQIEYTNDTILNEGRVVGCVVTLVVLALPDKRTLNFQFLAFNDALAWKITGGLLDSTRRSMRAMVAQDGNFATASFMIPNAFRKSVTPEGQLLAVLTDSGEYSKFTAAFFREKFLIDVLWIGTSEKLTYFIDVSPSKDVRNKFVGCVSAM